MGRYERITRYIRTNRGYVAQTCWIAHVLDDLGLTTRTAPNRLDPTKRVKPCPPSKRADIEEAIRALGISES